MKKLIGLRYGLLAFSLFAFSVFSWADTPNTDREFANLANSPYPAQHGNARNSDSVPYVSPTNLKLKWKALEDDMILQGCTTDRGKLYCARGRGKASNKCNLVALDERDGSIVWEDRINGECLLDEYAYLTNPTVDSEGNVYINDSKKIVSFTTDGELRWVNDVPATLPSRKGYDNPPFGLALLSDGTLATATLGDAWILFIDTATGKLTKKPFDLPAEKRALETMEVPFMKNERPKGFLEDLISPLAAQVLWDFGMGDGAFEMDNNVGVAERHQLLMLSSGAPYPNEGNTGALWAVSYKNDTPEVAFYVELDVPGGIATSPTVSKDNSMVLIGDNDRNLVVVNIDRCMKEATGGPCEHYSKHPVKHDLSSSVIITDSNRLIVPKRETAYAAYDLSIDSQGKVNLDEVWEARLSWFFVTATVHLAFENVVWVPFFHLFTMQPYIVALDINTGEEVARYKSGDAANVTMASDGKTIVANNISFVEAMMVHKLGFDRKVKSGVWAWEPVE